MKKNLLAFIILFCSSLVFAKHPQGDDLINVGISYTDNFRVISGILLLNTNPTMPSLMEGGLKIEGGLKMDM
jgi:hypothetical protein